MTRAIVDAYRSLYTPPEGFAFINPLYSLNQPEYLYHPNPSRGLVHISFHHANPGAGNESFLLRFTTGNDETPCVLVDAGHGVDLDALLTPTDRLVAICLTHAHLDHYSELTAAHRDDAPILTSPATAAILDDVFGVADVEYDVQTTEGVTDSITPVDDWNTVASGVEIHPVPAGHVPGAVGYLVRATEGDETHHLLATGDFTHRRAGGFPGFDPEGFVDIDALFLTAATNDRFEDSLTDALGTALEHAHGGAPTLVATSGLVGVQVAYQFAALVDEYDLGVPVRVVGHVAKLYEALDYECPGVELIPLFEDPQTCLDPGVITIAGPEIPRERSSGRLFGILREDPTACVVQLIGSGEDPLTDGRCTVHSYELVNHPTRETLVDVHDAIEPTETIIVHRHRGAEGAFNDLESVVWGSGDTDEYTLYDGNRWLRPPWMNGGTVTRTHERSVQQFAGSDLLASFPLPSLDRHDDPDLDAEGIDAETIATALHRGPDAAASPDAPTRADEQETTTSATTGDAMTTTDNDTDMRDREAREERPPMGLTQTTGPELSDEVDPDVRAAFEEGSLTSEDLAAVRAAQHHLTDDMESEDEPTDETDTDSEDDQEVDDDTGIDEESQSEAVVEADDADRSTTETTAVEVRADGTAETGETGDAEAPLTSASPPTESEIGVDGDRSATQSADVTDSTQGTVESEGVVEETENGVVLDLNPLAVALVDRVVQSEDDAEREFETIDGAIVEAVDQYVVALLAGEASGGEDEQFTISLSASPAVERTLMDAIAGDEQFESTAALVAEGVASVLGGESSAARELRGFNECRRHLDAAVRNEAYGFDVREAFVEAAIAWFLRERHGSERAPNAGETNAE